MASMHMHGYYSNVTEHGNSTNNITSSTDYAQERSLEQELIFHPFSCPARLSLDSSMNTCGLRHFSGLAKAIRKGISPMYMADPSEFTPAEVPDWLIEFRKKDTERKRIRRHGSAEKKEKAPVPAWLQMEKYRRNKRAPRVAPAESATTTGATYVSSTTFPILSILITDILSFLVAIVCLM
jgi:hypothetical protein